MAQNKLINDLEQTLGAVNLEPFSPTLSPLIEEALVESNKHHYRQGTFLMPKLLIWFVLAMTIRRDLNYCKVLEWMISSWRWLSLSLPAKLLEDSAITHARVKMGASIFLLIFQKLTLIFSGVEPDFYGFHTLYFDGTTLSMPDSKKNCVRFGKHRSQRGAAGFPAMRAVTLAMGVSRVTLDVAFSSIRGKGSGERSLMMKILRRIQIPQALFLFDAGFYSFALFCQLTEANQWFIMKISRSVHLNPLAGNPYFDGSYLALIKGKIHNPSRSTQKRNAYDHLEGVVRVIDVQVAGFRPFRLITSLLDLNIEAKELVKHYHKRWEIELSYDEIKTHQCATLRGQAPTILRSKRPDLVEQELYALLITYNMTRWLIFQAAQQHGIDPLHVSFLDTLQWIIDALTPMQSAPPHQLGEYHAYLHRMIAQSLIDRPRRKRQNPRVIKVKMSSFKRKRKSDRSQNIDYEKETKILPPPIEIQEFQEAA